MRSPRKALAMWVVASAAVSMPADGMAQTAGASVDWPATWPAGTEIRVWFERVGPDYQAMVWDAFRAWADAGIPLTVTPARSISDANVLFLEPRRPLDPSLRLGQTTIRGHDGLIHNAVVYFARVDHEGRPIPRGMRERTALHEVGHVLGLGHAEKGRIMHGVSSAGRVTSRDLADLARLYGAAVRRAETTHLDPAPS